MRKMTAMACRVCNGAPGPRLRLSVEDDGEGLSAAAIEQLFQPFNRLGQEGGATEGTGIGLVVSKRLVELMGGAIGVRSEVGVGSVFWIELLQAEMPQLHATEACDLGSPGLALQPAAGLATLLYVEDNPANMLLVEKLIARRPDLRLLFARDGRQGLDLARTALPDVILMDINLPGINGFQALQILRAHALTAAIPVIALSANAMPRDIARGLEAGFFRYLTKPIRVSEFLATLDLALQECRLPVRAAANPEKASP